MSASHSCGMVRWELTNNTPEVGFEIHFKEAGKPKKTDKDRAILLE